MTTPAPTGTGIMNTAKAFAFLAVAGGILVLGTTVYKDWASPTVETAGVTPEQVAVIADGRIVAKFGEDVDGPYINGSLVDLDERVEKVEAATRVAKTEPPPTPGPEKKDLADATPPPKPPAPATEPPAVVTPPPDSEPMFPGKGPLYGPVNPVDAYRLVVLSKKCGDPTKWPRNEKDELIDTSDAAMPDVEEFKSLIREYCDPDFDDLGPEIVFTPDNNSDVDIVFAPDNSAEDEIVFTPDDEIIFTPDK